MEVALRLSGFTTGQGFKKLSDGKILKDVKVWGCNQHDVKRCDEQKNNGRSDEDRKRPFAPACSETP